MEAALSERRPPVSTPLCGVVTALTSGVAYYIVPLVTALVTEPNRVRNSLDASNYVIEQFFAQSPLYHLAVLVLVPFVTTAVALTLARRAGRVGRETDIWVVFAVVVGPIAMVWLGAFVAWVAIAFQALAIALFGVLIALATAFVLSAGVAVVVTVSALAGYALAERLEPRPSQ